MESHLLLALVIVGSCTLTLVAYLCVAAWLRVQRVAEIFRRQGIDGPPPSFLSGNLSEMRARVAAAAGDRRAPQREEGGFGDYCKDIFPYFDKWRKAYGT